MIRHSAKVMGVSLTVLALVSGTAWAQRTYTREGQSGARMQQQSQQIPQKQVSGTIMRSKDVQVRTLGQDTGEKNRVVLLQTQQGERLVVDLGNKQQLQGLSLQQGMQLQAQGRPVRIGDRPVLLAERITVNGQTHRIQRPERSQARQITGQIQNMKEVNIRGTDRTNKVVLLQTQQGRQMVVDLGPTENLQNVRLQQGTQLQVQGRPVRIGDQLVLLANQLSAQGQTVHIDRPQQQMSQQQPRGQFQRQVKQYQQSMRQQVGSQWTHPQASKLNVTSASEIIDRPVQDTQGRQVGTVEYVMIDAQNGDVLYAVIGSDGGELNLGNEFVVVPWSATELSPQALRINKSLNELKNAPRFSRQRLNELSQPTVVSLIWNYYLVPENQQTQGTQQQQQAQMGQGQQQQQRAQQQQQAQKSQGQQQGTRQQGEQANQPRLLIGRDIVTTLIAPSLTSVEEARGTEVTSADGTAVGEIEKVIIDPDHGHVAYVLLKQEGFLGIGSEWLPVPFQALQWSMLDQNYALNVSEQQLQQMPRLPRTDLPAQVSPDQLRQLYANFNVTPYWARAAQFAERPGAGRNAIAATVQEIDQQQGTVTLQTASGKTVDLQVPSDMLSNLQAGDRVEVTIRQSSSGQ